MRPNSHWKSNSGASEKLITQRPQWYAEGIFEVGRSSGRSFQSDSVCVLSGWKLLPVMPRMHRLKPPIVHQGHGPEDRVVERRAGSHALAARLVISTHRRFKPDAPLGWRCRTGSWIHGLVRLCVPEPAAAEHWLKETVPHQRTKERWELREPCGLAGQSFGGFLQRSRDVLHQLTG